MLEFILYLFIFYFLFNSLLLLSLSFLGKSTTKKTSIKPNEDYNYLILIPAYKEDYVIQNTVDSALSLPYKNKSICVISDHMKNETNRILDEKPIYLLKADYNKSTKVNALKCAIETINFSLFDYIILLDADNTLEKSALTKISNSIKNGMEFIQLRRLSKPTRTDIALLDGLSEDMNNQFFRTAFNTLNMPASYSGSGMVFPADTFITLIPKLNAIGGFDKELDFHIIASKYHVHYLEDCVVNDEKVSTLNQFKQQRKRWISCQFHYLNELFIPYLKLIILQKRITPCLKIIQLAQLPRLILIGMHLPLIILEVLFFNNYISVLSFFTIVIAFYNVLPKPVTFTLFKKVLRKLPQLFAHMSSIFFELKHANTEFIHTEHNQ